MLKTKQGKVKIIKKKIQLCSGWFWGSQFPALNHRFWSLSSGFHITAAWHSASLVVLDGCFFVLGPQSPPLPTVWATPLLTLKAAPALRRETLERLTRPVGELVASGATLRLGQGQNCHLTAHSALTCSPVLPILPWLGPTVMATYIATSSRPKAPPSACPDGQLHS